MAGGVSTTALVRAAAEAGAAAFLPAGYLSPEAVERDLRELRGTGRPYGLNIFVPSPSPGAAFWHVPAVLTGMRCQA